jgi:hypothetical protein
LQRRVVEDVVDPSRVHDVRLADERLQEQCIRTGAALDEVDRRVDVCPGVDAEVEPTDVRGRPGCDRLRPLQSHVRVALVDDHPGPDRDADVDLLHVSRPGRSLV